MVPDQKSQALTTPAAAFSPTRDAATTTTSNTIGATAARDATMATTATTGGKIVGAENRETVEASSRYRLLRFMVPV